MQVGGTYKQGMEGYEDLVRSHLFSPFSNGKEQGLRAYFEVKALVGLEQDLENPFPQRGAKTFLREIIKLCLSETAPQILLVLLWQRQRGQGFANPLKYQSQSFITI